MSWLAGSDRSINLELKVMVGVVVWWWEIHPATGIWLNDRLGLIWDYETMTVAGFGLAITLSLWNLYYYITFYAQYISVSQYHYLCYYHHSLFVTPDMTLIYNTTTFCSHVNTSFRSTAVLSGVPSFYHLKSGVQLWICWFVCFHLLCLQFVLP